MRINLTTPFAEKDAVKALGARWDATRKVWYIVDVQDLTPFLRWIENAQDRAGKSVALGNAQSRPAKAVPRSLADMPMFTLAATEIVHCGCVVLPWEDCMHTRSA
ncbi:MAG: DUF5710 domain-containing protein [Simplicispira sp.]|nr:DUF5710 domain-containing protein [Simplicispira sp.]